MQDAPLKQRNQARRLPRHDARLKPPGSGLHLTAELQALGSRAVALVPRHPNRQRAPSRASSSFTVLLQRSFTGERDAGPTGRPRCVRRTRVVEVVTIARGSPSIHYLLSIAPSRLKNICAVSTGRHDHQFITAPSHGTPSQILKLPSAPPIRPLFLAKSREPANPRFERVGKG